MKSALNFRNRSSTPILIIDRVGVIGEAIARHFYKENLIVLISEELLSEDNPNILHIPFKRNIPEAPDNEYSKIFIVDDGSSVTRESAFSFIDKALENNAPLFFIGSIRNVDIEHADDVAESYDNAKVLIFGDLFDKDIVFDKESSISQFILSVRKGQEIQVSGNGLSLNFPITFSDTIKLIVKATELQIQQKTILLFSGHPITDISLANIFKKINPDIKIDFTKQGKKKKIYLPKGAMHALEKYDLEDRIKKVSLESSNKKTKNVNNNLKKSYLPSIIFFLLIAFFIFLLPLFSTFTLIYLGGSQLKSAQLKFEAGELEKALGYSKSSEGLYKLSNKTFFFLSKEAKLLGFNVFAEDTKKKVLTGKSLSLASVEILEGIIISKKIYQGESISPKEDILKASNSIRNGLSLIENIRAGDALLQDSPFKNLEPFAGLVINSPETFINVLGFDKEKKYLVLFLNSNEIRPSGGVVSKLGILKIKNGNMSSFEEFPTDRINEESSLNIEPPYQLRRYLGLKNLLIEDSTFEPDFLATSKYASGMYQERFNQSVDGVIGINSDFFKKINNVSFDEFINSLGEGIKTKNVIFAFSNPGIENVFKTIGWSSTILDQRPAVSENVNDFLGIAETSIGKNSSNQVSRSVSKKIILNTGGIISSDVTIAVKNSGSKTYSDYIEFILPEKYSISEIKVDGKKQEITPAITTANLYESKNFKAPKGLEVYQYAGYGKSVVGFLIAIPSQGVKTITLSYTLPNLITKSQDSFNYSLNIYKQPGIPSYDFSFTFLMPAGYQLVNSKKELNFEIDGDKNVSAFVSKK